MQLSMRDVIGILNVPEHTVCRWMDDKQLPTQKVSGRYRFNSEQLFEWATLNHIDVAPSAFAQFTDTGGNQVRFDTALEAGGVFTDIRGKDAGEIVRRIVETLPLPATFDRDNLVMLILAGNGLRATAIGDGIALPHPRLPIVIPGRPPAVSLCFLAEPLPAETSGGQPIHTLFLLLCPTVHAHLQLLARIAYAARDEKFRDLLHRRAAAAELLREAQRVEEAFRSSNGRENRKNGNGTD